MFSLVHGRLDNIEKKQGRQLRRCGLDRYRHKVNVSLLVFSTLNRFKSLLLGEFRELGRGFHVCNNY